MKLKSKLKFVIQKKRKMNFTSIFQNSKNKKMLFSLFKKLIFWIILPIHGLPTYQNKFWCDPFQKEKQKTKIKISWFDFWKTKKKLFLNLFWLKINFKKQKLKFWNSFFDFKSKNGFQKVLSFFNFGYEIEKWKTKNFQDSFRF